MSKRRVLFVASTGGHLKELMQLESMFDKYDFNLITEKTKSNLYLKDKFKNKVYYMVYGTKDHMLTYPFKFLYNCIYSVLLFFKLHPDYIVTTGTHTAVPIPHDASRSKTIRPTFSIHTLSPIRHPRNSPPTLLI